MRGASGNGRSYRERFNQARKYLKMNSQYFAMALVVLIWSLTIAPVVVVGGTSRTILPPEEIERQKQISEWHSLSKEALDLEYNDMQERILGKEIDLTCDAHYQCNSLSWNRACNEKVFFLYSEKQNPFIQGMGPLFSDTDFSKLVSSFYDLHEVHMTKNAEKKCRIFSLEKAFCVSATCQAEE